MKIFDKVYVKLGNLLFPAMIWGKSKFSIDGEQLIDVLVVIGDVCLPRTYTKSKIYDAKDDKLFTFDTKRQLLSLSQPTQNHSDTLS